MTDPRFTVAGHPLPDVLLHVIDTGRWHPPVDSDLLVSVFADQPSDPHFYDRAEMIRQNRWFPRRSPLEAFSPDGATLLFTGTSPPSLARVPAAGGTPSIVTTLEPDDHRHVYPHFLPDGRHFLYAAIGLGNEVEVRAASLDSPSAPKIAITLSPMNWLGTPPASRTASPTASKKSSCT